MNKNIDEKTVRSFGNEWHNFDQGDKSFFDGDTIFKDYFSLIPDNFFNKDLIGFDMGCGTGRWAKYIAPQVKHLNCIDPSEAINIAKKNLQEFQNISYFQNSVDDNFLEIESQDFGYSLGVLHHIPNTKSAIQSCVNLLKPGAPLLLYLYYNFENRGILFRALWKLSEIIRFFVSNLPHTLKHFVTNVIALLIYLPLARMAMIVKYFSTSYKKMPLSYYHDKSFYTMRTDSRDRFGTPLEQRFSRSDISQMLSDCGMTDIVFRDREPYWCVLSKKK